MMKHVAWHRKSCVAVICILFAGCAAQTESRAIEQANAAARAEGYDLTRHKADARYNLSGDGIWTVFYNPRPDARGLVAHGDHFFVTVNRAGTGTLVPGY